MKTLTTEQQEEIASLKYYTLPENQGHPHCPDQAIWSPNPSNPGEFAVMRRWDWDDNCGQLSNTRHEYEVYKWEGEDEDPMFQSLTLGELVATFSKKS